MDHSGGIPAVVAGVGPARAEAGRPPMVLDLHPDRPRQRGVRMPPQFGGGVLLFSEVCRRGTRSRHEPRLCCAIPLPRCRGPFPARPETPLIWFHEGASLWCRPCARHASGKLPSWRRVAGASAVSMDQRRRAVGQLCQCA